MSEPWYPAPPPETDSMLPALCPECGNIVDAGARPPIEGRAVGRCQDHGIVFVVYADSHDREKTKEVKNDST